GQMTYGLAPVTTPARDPRKAVSHGLTSSPPRERVNSSEIWISKERPSMSNTQPGSAYFLDKSTEVPETHTFSVLVDNEPGVLARIAGLFSGRGYNIESLTVSETQHAEHL